MKKNMYKEPQMEVMAVRPMMLMTDGSLLGGRDTEGEELHAD